MKIRLNENDLKSIIKETLKKCLYENYGTSSFFDGYPELEKLEMLVYKFTLNDIESDDSNVDFSDFVKGIVTLFNMSLEYQDYNRYNLYELYKNAISNGDEDSFWNDNKVINYDYIDEFINDPKLWQNYMVNPEELKQMIESFNQWLERYTESEIENYTKQKWSEYRYYNKQLNSII